MSPDRAAGLQVAVLSVQVVVVVLVVVVVVVVVSLRRLLVASTLPTAPLSLNSWPIK